MAAPRYQIIDTLSPRGAPEAETAAAAARNQQLMAIEQYNAAEFRDETGAVFHRYDLPGASVLHSPFRHYFRYFCMRYHELNPRQLKFRYIQYALQILRKIALHRKTASILEVGSTLGENYLMLRDAQELESMNLKVDYVGLDIDTNAVALARELFCGDRHFQSVLGEGSDLRRFPDQTFDIVMSNGVHSHLYDAAEGIREAMRVSRVAVLLHILTTVDPNSPPITMRSPFVEKLVYHVFPMRSIVDHIRGYAPFYLYWPSRDWPFTDRSNPYGDDGKYLDEVDEQKIRWDMLILSRFKLFPDLSDRFARFIAP